MNRNETTFFLQKARQFIANMTSQPYFHNRRRKNLKCQKGVSPKDVLTLKGAKTFHIILLIVTCRSEGSLAE